MSNPEAGASRRIFKILYATLRKFDEPPAFPTPIGIRCRERRSFRDIGMARYD